MYQAAIQFHNGHVHFYKCDDDEDPRNYMCLHLNYYMLLRHQGLEVAQQLIHKNAYLYELATKSVVKHFGAKVLELKKIDGRTRAARELRYFSVEEFLRNY